MPSAVICAGESLHPKQRFCGLDTQQMQTRKRVSQIPTSMKAKKTAVTVNSESPGTIKKEIDRQDLIQRKRWELESKYRQAVGARLFDRIVIDQKQFSQQEMEEMQNNYLRFHSTGDSEAMAAVMVDAEEARKHFIALVKSATQKVSE